MKNLQSVTVTVCGVALLLGGGCSSFKEAGRDLSVNEPEDQAVSVDLMELEDMSVVDSADLGARDTLTIDLGPDHGMVPDPDQTVEPVPLDTECAEPWTLEPKSDPACAPRTVRYISDQAMDLTNLAVAVSATGRVGIMFNSKSWADEGVMYVAALEGQDLELKEFTRYAFEVVGPAGAMDAADDGTFHLAYLIRGDMSNDVVYQQYRADGVVTSLEPVASSFSSQAQVALGLNPAKEALVVFYNSSTGEVRSKLRSTGGIWGAEQGIEDCLEPQAAFSGQLSLTLSDSHLFHLAFTDTDGASTAVPKHFYHDGSSWKGPTTIDNKLITGLYGFSIGLAVRGNQRYATYLAFLQNKAEVRLARWSQISTVPDISVLDTTLLLSSDDPQFSSSMAMDSHGLLHLVMVDPLTSSTGRLVYRRQYPVAGELVWYEDVIDEDVWGLSTRPIVDLALDEDDQPHIAYFSSKQSKVFYATRDDR